MYYLRANVLLAIAAVAVTARAAQQTGTYQYQCVFDAYSPEYHNLTYSFIPRADHAVYSTPVHHGSAIALDHFQIQIPVGPTSIALGGHVVFENITEFDFLVSGATPTPFNIANLKAEAGTGGGSYQNITSFADDSTGAVAGPTVYAGPFRVSYSNVAVIRLGQITGTSQSYEIEADGSIGPVSVGGPFFCLPLPDQTLFTFAVAS